MCEENCVSYFINYYVFSCSSVTFAFESTNIANEELSKIYGIPVAVISELPAETRLQLSSGINQGNVIASDEAYVKISYNENGESITG